jgi:hexulose-6-phosphate isomerase
MIIDYSIHSEKWAFEKEEKRMERRTLLQCGLASCAAMALTGQSLAANQRKIKKTLKMGMIQDPNAKTPKEKFQIAKKAGFDAVEPDYLFSKEEAKSMKKAADEVGIRLDAIICPTHWKHPLSSNKAEDVQTTMDAMEQCMNNATIIGADVVLLVPAVVTPQVMYKEAYIRSKAHVKELAETAERLKVTIGLENVWNKFLLSPLEFQRYLDEVGSEYVKAFFDIGNFNFWSYPQDWIRTLDNQICRMDVKDFDNKKFAFVELLQGSVPWKEVMEACDDIGYEGYFAAEVAGGNLEHLTQKVSQRMDKIISM